MFVIDANKNITMTQGDTGHFIVRPTGVTFSSGDVGLFTVKSDKGVQVMQRVYEIEDGQIQVDFENDDTDQWSPGKYKWEMRYFVEPEYDDQHHLISGTEVYTPRRQINTRMLILEEAIGNV